MRRAVEGGAPPIPAPHGGTRRLGAARRLLENTLRSAALCTTVLALALARTGGAQAAPPCERAVYLTFDTGHMGVADLVADVLRRHEVRATFFLANERTRSGGTSLDDRWADWWRARAAEGHAFGSHTWDHDVWRADLPEGRLRVRPTQGPQAGRDRVLDAAGYCDALAQPARRLEQMTGHAMGSVFRAPAGKVSPALHAAAEGCGWTHVGWSAAGFLGDELPSDRHPNAQLLARALRDIRPGDVLLAHLGIWSRQDPWAPAVLEPLIVGLKQRGLCFATLREHPKYGAAARRAAP
jgi:peptidoglycan-N-acetylmuramic acid deacetylase